MEQGQQLPIPAPPKNEYWLYRIDEEIFAPESLENDKMYVWWLRIFGFDNYRIVAKKIEHEYNIELDLIRDRHIALNESSEWFFKELLTFLSRNFDRPLNKHFSAFYLLTLSESNGKIKSLIEFANLYAWTREEDIKILEDANNRCESLITNPNGNSYFSLLRILLSLLSFIKNISKINKKYKELGIVEPKKLSVKQKLNAVFTLIIEDILYRKLFTHMKNYRDSFLEYEKNRKLLNPISEIITPDNDYLGIRIFVMRYIFEELGIDYNKNKNKILTLLYYLFSDCRGHLISNFYIQEIYESNTTLPCANCKHSHIRNTVIEKLKLFGNENIVKKIENSNHCCKDKIDDDEYNSEQELTFDVSYIKKDRQQRHYAIVFDYFIKELGLKSDVNRTDKTNFIIWVTGVKNNSKRFQDTEMYNYLSNPLGEYNQSIANTLKDVEQYLSGMGLKNIEEKIKKDFKNIKEENLSVKI